MAGSRRDVRGAYDLCRRGLRIVVERVGREVHILVAHLHVEVKYRQLRLGIVLPPVGDECRLAVNHLAALEEIGIVVKTVEVQTVGIERRPSVLQLHVASRNRHLVVAVVEGVLREQRERISLIHTHMAEGLEGVGSLVEEGAVAMQRGPFVAELHLAVQYLCVTVLVHVVVQHVGMDEVDPLVLHLWLSGAARTLLGSIRKGAGIGCQQREQQQIKKPPHNAQLSTIT